MVLRIYLELKKSQIKKERVIKIIRGTTPTCTFELPFDTSIIDKLYITFSQNNEEVLNFTKDNCTFDGKNVNLKLKQEDTLKLNDKLMVNIQLRLLATDGEALASQIIRTHVDAILRDGVI